MFSPLLTLSVKSQVSCPRAPISTLSARSVPRRLDGRGPNRPTRVGRHCPEWSSSGPAGLLASAAVDRAATRALRPTDAGRVNEILRRLAELWKAPALADIPVALNPRLSQTLGRLARRPWRIELGPRALVSSKRLREVVTHEGAHAALALKAGTSQPAPHGPEWRRLMALAGYPQATGAHCSAKAPPARALGRSSSRTPSHGRPSPTTTGAPSASPADRPAGR
jgi:hypothetical protein